MPAKKPPPGKRFRLRLYERLFEMIRWPTFLLVFAAYALWWISPDLPLPSAGRDLMLVVTLISLLLFIAGLIAPALCFVQCRADHLLISTTVYRVTVSYSRLGNITPVNFDGEYPLNQQPWSQRRFLKPLYREQRTGQLTALSVELKKYPLPLRWLKLWFTAYMFMPRATGFLFLVNDWLALSRQIGDYREQWRARLKNKGDGASSIAGQLLSNKGR